MLMRRRLLSLLACVHHHSLLATRSLLKHGTRCILTHLHQIQNVLLLSYICLFQALPCCVPLVSALTERDLLWKQDLTVVQLMVSGPEEESKEVPLKFPLKK